MDNALSRSFKKFSFLRALPSKRAVEVARELKTCEGGYLSLQYRCKSITTQYTQHDRNITVILT